MTKKLLVLFLGNPILSDDRIGLVLGETLRTRLESEGHDVKTLEKTGFSLIDYLENHNEVVIVDSIKTGKYKAGQLVPVKLEELHQYSPFSSHYAGIPETLKMMRQLDLSTPQRIHVLGVEVQDPYAISEEMSDRLRERLSELAEETHRIITSIAQGDKTESRAKNSTKQ